MIWNIQGIDSALRGAYLRGDGTDSRVVWLSYDSDPSGGNMTGEVANARFCESFVESEPCTELEYTLCFVCGAGWTDRLCY